MARSYLMENIELKHGKPIREIIREQVEAGKNQDEIARYLGVSYWTLRSWLYRLRAEFSSTVTFADEAPETASTP